VLREALVRGVRALGGDKFGVSTVYVTTQNRTLRFTPSLSAAKKRSREDANPAR